MTRSIFSLVIITFFCKSFPVCAQTVNASTASESSFSFPKKEVVVINSGFAEARPLISLDGSALYFSRRYHPKNSKGEKDFQDVWVSYQDSITGQWSEPENLGPVINNKKRNAIASLSPDGMDGIFFNTYKKTKKMPLARSRRSGNSWTKPRVLNIENFVNVSDYADYFVEFKNKVLILAIQADSTMGDQDLYVSFLDPYGGWKEPINMGPILNTEKAEFAPFIGSNDRFMFFCSYGHDGMGGSDIYMSYRLDDSWLNWSKPVNLGAGINSEHEETYFSVTGDYKYLYYTSYPSKATDRNISRVELSADFLLINGPILAQMDSQSIAYYKEREGMANPGREEALAGGYENKKSALSEIPVDSSIALNSAFEKEITLEIEKALKDEGKVLAGSIGENLVTAATNNYNEAGSLSPAAEELKSYLEEAFPELEIEVRQKQQIVEYKIVQNLLYDFNSVYVKPEYLQRLSNMARVLRVRPELKVQLIGHTDNLGAEEINKRVAGQRVQNLFYYFKNRKVGEERIEIVGAGPGSPIASNEDEEGRNQNRRVETILLFMEK